ncbi:hypothetical protein EB796_015394 [Bugula neritina]|uniref:Caspase family p10 domain-containing protein n=1 Tax=Bugula neritina TaxID=10212 RepID=A0A7J7JIZ6_BUGNE|nr:hypothetical protein EB796_015394 [Bugula neritina]
MLILQSCFDGRKSYRHSNYGSPFIRELVKTLYKHSSHTDLATLFDILETKLYLILMSLYKPCWYLGTGESQKGHKKLAEKHSHAAQQVPVVTKTLTGLRKVLLFPKYKVCPDAE